MDIALLIKGIVGLIVVLAVLIMIFLLPAKFGSKKEKSKKTPQEPIQTKQEEQLTFEQIRSIIKNRNSTTDDLAKAIDQLVLHYAKITPKLGIRSHPDFDKYVEIIVYLVRHPNTNKDLVLKLDKALSAANSEYRAELNDALTKALNSRGGR